MKLMILIALAALAPIAQASSLQAIRLLHVSQYENRLPGLQSSLVTLVEFEVETCRMLTESEVKAHTKKSSGGMKLAVTLPRAQCLNSQKQTLSTTTTEVPAGISLTIENPVLIETLLPAQ